MEKIDQKPKIKPFLIGNELKTKDLRQTAVGRARGSPQNQNQNPRIAYAERRVKPLARLLRCATALRVTAPLGCGSRSPGMPERFPFGPSTRPEPPLFPHKQSSLRIGPEQSGARSGEANP